MSSSTGSPSRKIGWFKSMCAKIDHELVLREAAMRIADGGKASPNLPKDKGGFHKPKNLIRYGQLIEDAKHERQRRLEKERKQQSKKKESENEN